MGRYDRRYGRYDEDPRGRRPAGRFHRGWGAGPYTAWYPGAYWAGDPMFGWGAGMWGWPPYAPVGFGAYERGLAPRRRPEESPTYGRRGDEAVRRWARSHGYDEGYEVRPRRGGPRNRG